MKRLFVVLVVLVVAVAAIGLYRGWFSVAWDKGEGKEHLTGTVDNEKIEADKKAALEKVHGLGASKGNTGTTTTKD